MTFRPGWNTPRDERGKEKVEVRNLSPRLIMCDHDDNGYRCPYFCIISQFDTLAPIFTNSDTDN